ncbi:MAG: hypothetical protein [Caudoviricetes sp.]|nr:MAG: hypothetical protein [Caudoviricetes sp.]
MAKKNIIVDSLRALLSGMGDPKRDKLAGSSYDTNIFDDVQLEAMYRTAWLGRKIVDIPADDAFRKGRSWQAKQDQITKIEDEEKRLDVIGKLLLCKKQARLWGGAAIYLGTDDENLEEPINPEALGQGGLRYLTVLSRRELTAGQLEDDPTSPYYNKPAYYQLQTGRDQGLFIHPSRFAVQIGNPVPDPKTAGRNSGWGDSVLQMVYEEIRKTDATSSNIATMVFEANVDVYKVPGLMEKVASAPYRSKVLERYSLANLGKSINRALMLDKEEEFERKNMTFTGLPEILEKFLLLVAGAADIPVTRLLGQSPSGMNSTGEHDMNNYYDRVATIQSLEIDPAISVLNDCLIVSALGKLEKEIFYKWNPLKQMTEKEQAEINKSNADTAEVLTRTGLFMPEEMRQVVGNQFVENGTYPGLADLLKQNDAKRQEFDLGEETEEPEIDPATGEAIDAQQAAVPSTNKRQPQ